MATSSMTPAPKSRSQVSTTLPASLFSKGGQRFDITDDLWEWNTQQQHLLLRYLALPLKYDNDRLWLGVESSSNLSAFETFGFLTGKMIEPVELDSFLLKNTLRILGRKTRRDGDKVRQMMKHSSQSVSDGQGKKMGLPEFPDDPIVLLLNQLFERALQQSASDLHLEPQQTETIVRLRIDGVLQKTESLPREIGRRLIARLKNLAEVDVSEFRLPQDGSFQHRTPLGDEMEFRLSTLPTQQGEKAVLRIQQNAPLQTDFTLLGMTSTQQHKLKRALSQPQGLILVTGPTGSGKSITLYSALSWLNNAEKNIMTAEDPIEMQIEGVVQTQVNSAIGLTFSRLLRTFLRQDPDVIMLGEIRDEESAKMALRAAQTGHLVLSTLHTNDASSAVGRLLQLGITQQEIDNSLLLVIAQRLLRRCNNKESENRYKGRVGVYQLLNVTHHQRQDGTLQWYTQYDLDYPSLHDSARLKITAGITDEKEVHRVLGLPTTPQKDASSRP